MLQFVARRVAYGAVTLFAVSVIVFGLLQTSGGGPLDRLKANPRIQQDTIQQITEFYGLDRPAHEQYLSWVTNYVQGDWGISFQSTEPVTELIGERVLGTMRLMLTALVLAVVLGVSFGLYQAIRQYSVFDNLGTAASFVAFSAPSFIVGIGLQVLFAVYLERWTGVKFFYTAGMNSAHYAELGFWAQVGDTVQHLTLPAASLALGGIAMFSRFQRAAMLDVLGSDYLRTARAKGLSRRRVILRHALRNALLPIVTLVSLNVAGIIGGAIITESIFGWPGIGRLYVQAIGTLDYPVIMAVVMAIGIGTVIMNVLADVAYGFLDPRVRVD